MSTTSDIAWPGYGSTIVTVPKLDRQTKWLTAKRHGGAHVSIPEGLTTSWVWPTKGIKVSGRVEADIDSNRAVFRLALVQPSRSTSAEHTSTTSPQLAANSLVKQLVGLRVLSQNTRVSGWQIFALHVSSSICRDLDLAHTQVCDAFYSDSPVVCRPPALGGRASSNLTSNLPRGFRTFTKKKCFTMYDTCAFSCYVDVYHIVFGGAATHLH
jgi:hypothetical protein